MSCIFMYYQQPEIKIYTTFYNTIKIWNALGINFTKDVQDPHSGTRKHCWDLTKREVSLVVNWGVQCCQDSSSPHAHLQLHIIQTKILGGFFAEIGKQILKFLWKYNGPRTPKTSLPKKG